MRLDINFTFTPLIVEIRTVAPAELAQINTKLDNIMATQTDLKAQLEDVLALQTKTSGEITALQTSVDDLNTKIAELELVISTGEVKPELTAAVAAVKAQAILIDEQIPDLPPPPVEG